MDVPAGDVPLPLAPLARPRSSAFCPLRLRRTIAIVCNHSKLAPRAGSEAAAMVQTTNRFFDEVARLMNDAAGAAQGVRREFETLFRTQAERVLRELDVVRREDFEAVKDMARIAREENEALKARVAALEAALGRPGHATDSPSTNASAGGSAGLNPGAA
jgi:BMFP domain-containing protein YqiC